MVIVKATLVETFTDLISTSLENNGLKISPAAEAYVVEVMTDLSSGVHSTAPRAIVIPELFRKALDSDGLIRREYLRVTGDVALFTSGIFPDSFESRKIAFCIGDFIDIGQTAYGELQADVFDELSHKFPQVVAVLNNVSVEIELTSKDLTKYLKRRRMIDARVSRR